MEKITDFIKKKQELALKRELLFNEKWFLPLNDSKRDDIQDQITVIDTLIGGLESLIGVMQEVNCESLGDI